MVIIIRHFLVDSENVNDNWLMLFDMADEDDEIIVFYTKKSPHMSYMSVIRLMENNKINIRFEESYEGTNALDFQLVSYMGYLMGCAGSFSENKCDAASAESCADEYIIMSNDTGYDPAVRFWKDKGFAVRRFNVNFCKQAVQRRKNIKYQVVADIPSKEDNVNTNIDTNIDTDNDNDAITAKSYNLNELFDGNHSSYTDSEPLNDELSTNDDLPASDELTTNDDLPANDKLITNDDLPFTDEQHPDNGLPFKDAVSPVLKSEKTASEDFDHFEVDSFLNCMGKDNLLKLHETLVHVYGMKQGQTIYKTIKDKSYSYTPEKLTRKKKVERFTGIIFAHSDIDDPGDFVDFLEKNRNKTKNLNGIRSAITKSYGETDGLKYYSLFKPYFKIISALK
nr:PIN domain-containing protein [uncultured Agathobacter sp.]